MFMAKQLTIGEVAKRTGLSTKTIRFYEEEGCIPAVGRNDAGYRQYSEGDVWRLRLVKHIRLLGLPLTEVKSLVTESLNSECAVFATSPIVSCFAMSVILKVPATGRSSDLRHVNQNSLICIVK